ncbi:MAG: TIGR02281 family clan AA aspartic protease [Dongiaceae bacterium]
MIRSPRAKEAAINRLIVAAATVAALGLTVLLGWTLGSTDSQPSVNLAAESSGPKTLTLKTSRQGPHHIIRAALVGPNGRTQLVSLIVDTGATDMVLPASMIRKLGFRSNELSATSIQTANGVTHAQRGQLRSVELGGPDISDVIERVPVLFMSDADIGGYALMGMSVLGRYSMTIEDAEDRIVLVKRR